MLRKSELHMPAGEELNPISTPLYIKQCPRLREPEAVRGITQSKHNLIDHVSATFMCDFANDEG